mmetsp:Transcript_115667/g.247205  ORF Transcript_115667/g.247205 Transcript_115667/m.247205 type:complete len:240 (+) Transcript_115667:773-1492(+)
MEPDYESPIQCKGDKCSRANGKALANSSGGVARSIKRISGIAHPCRELGHLCDASSIVRDGAESVNGEAACKRGEHPQCGKSDAIEVAEGERHKDGRCQHEDGNDATHVAQRHAIDDVHCRAGLASCCELSCWNVRVRGEVLGDETNDQTPDGAHRSAPESLHRRACDHRRRAFLQSNTFETESSRKHCYSKEPDHGQHEKCRKNHLHLQHDLNVFLLLHRVDMGRNKRAEDAHDDATC